MPIGASGAKQLKDNRKDHAADEPTKTLRKSGGEGFLRGRVAHFLIPPSEFQSESTGPEGSAEGQQVGLYVAANNPRDA